MRKTSQGSKALKLIRGTIVLEINFFDKALIRAFDLKMCLQLADPLVCSGSNLCIKGALLVKEIRAQNRTCASRTTENTDTIPLVSYPHQGI